MKTMGLVSVLSLLVATAAFASPGKNHLVCQSSAKSGSAQKVQLDIERSSAEGYYAPQMKITIDGKPYAISTPNVNDLYGETIHDAALGVIVVTANNSDVAKSIIMDVQVMGVPGSVKAFDQNGKPVTYDLKNDDGGECIDGYGKATFQGVLTGTMQDESVTPIQSIPLEPQILDCTLEYDTGSAC